MPCCNESDHDQPSLNPSNLLALPLESTLSVATCPILLWLGPRNSIKNSAKASAEASAMASATLAASTASNAIKKQPSALLDNSVLIKESPMFALFGNLKSGKLVAGKGRVMVVKYKAIDPAAFTLKTSYRKLSSQRRAIQRVSADTTTPTNTQLQSEAMLKETAETTTVIINIRKIKRKLKKLKRLVHENIVRFLFAAVSVDPDPKINPQPPNTKKSRSYASLFYTVFQNCSRGTLDDALSCLRFPLPLVIKLSLCCDLLQGLLYLHKKYPHGRLSSRTCYVTETWRLKIYFGGFDQLAENLTATSPAYSETYELYATKFFAAPEHIEVFPKHTKSVYGDVYSAGLIMNMILDNGMRPFEDQKNLGDVIKKIATDTKSSIRPALQKSTDEILGKVIQDCWSFNPVNRPPVKQILRKFQHTFEKLLPFDRRRKTPNAIELHLTKEFACELNAYLHELESANSHVSSTLGEAVTKRLADGEIKLQLIREDYQRQIDGLTQELALYRENVDTQQNYLGLESETMRSRIRSVERELIMAKLGFLPEPFVKTMTDAIVTYAAAHGSAGTMFPDIDSFFRPTLFPNSSVMIASIVGFNRFVQQLHNYPKALIEILRSYYKGIDDAIAAASPSGKRVHVVDRVADAVILVAGASNERNERTAADCIDVGILLIQWAAKWDSTKIMAGSNTKLMLRIGIHSGSVLAGVIGKTPKLLLMGDTLNVATAIESQCGVQEMRMSSISYSGILSAGLEENYLVEQQEDLDMRQRGKIGIYKVVVDRNIE